MIKYKIEKIFETKSDESFFFGYFNTPQISSDDKKLLALKIKKFNEVPNGNDIAEVGWFDLEENDQFFYKIGETTAFNWQQGAQLQFLGPDFKNKVIWNFFDKNLYKSRIYDLEFNTFYDVPAIYNPFPDGKFATTIDYERHYWFRRGYSYQNIKNLKKNKSFISTDAIWKVDLTTGDKFPIILLGDLIKIKPLSSMQNAVHYLEHMTASPDSNKFAFLHRWRHENGIHSRLLVSDCNGEDIKVINDSGRMSHFCWSSNKTIIGYGGKATAITNFRKSKILIKTIFKYLLPIYKKIVKDNTGFAKSITGDAYYIFNVEKTITQKLILPNMRNEDGHPTMNNNGNFFITDTYARSALNQKPKLFIAFLDIEKFEQIEELESIKKYDETPVRCDLHPRLSRSGKILSIDTMDGNNRRIYAYALKKITSES